MIRLIEDQPDDSSIEEILRELAFAAMTRVLKPGGRFYAEEVLACFIDHPVVRRLLDHPGADRFDTQSFRAGLSEAGLLQPKSRQFVGAIGWFTAARATSRPPTRSS